MGDDMANEMVIDALAARISQLKNPSITGLDPRLDMIPPFIIEKNIAEHGRTAGAVASSFLDFNHIIIEAVADIVPAVKPNIAFYEKYGAEGVAAYISTVAFAKEKGMVVIGDIKRGDIGSTAEAYAAHISPVDIFGVPTDIWREDFITVSAYMGMDSLEPFARKAEETGKGIFVLVKTSNPGGADVQDLAIQDADAVNEILLYERVGKLAELAGARLIGKCGYSSVGAVVGATHEKEGARLRDLLPRTFFLVPGFGAQGASAEGLRGFFDVNGGGAAVNSSRGITCAWKELPLSPEEIDADALAVAVRSAAVAMKGSLESVLGQ